MTAEAPGTEQLRKRRWRWSIKKKGFKAFLEDVEELKGSDILC